MSGAAGGVSAAPERFDVVVVGAGIVGLGAALAAVDRGRSVLVVDRASEIAGASIRNFGHLCFTPQSGVARDYAATSRKLWLRLARDAGFWIDQAGTLVLARHEDELALLRELAERRRAQDEGEAPEVELLTASDVEELAALPAGTAVGGARLPRDLQVDPRFAADAIRDHLAARGVVFRMRTAAGRIVGGRVETSRGPVDAGLVVVAVNHDIDQLYPELAERRGVIRCGLDMLRVTADLPRPLGGPLLTGWSLIRYSAFAGLPGSAAVRERLGRERPELAALDLNQMYTQRPDGSLIVGDSHWKGETVPPFQPEAAPEAFLAEFRTLFDRDPAVVERWQGVYATGPEEFLIEEVEPGVLVTVVTTGIGMTTGLGLAEHVVGGHLDTHSRPLTESTRP
ncbi:TIGR03364 family FAD-dependent oxidoreductase [Plantibacter sp. VKM Ac-2880]|uniref:TIGR03364 family FAD-dependent oxidoreductase n=1 Tax=Plantibacter sp. VKM Ac-2880 TaxID=2783827 RepID=UPI00188E0688|nr:TIGR03364 family FAD-dependent oxidoreductase [Plantibacter sp. VKM Ac-2880]MBF4569083.1 TIGR03364 family FAD-dependent oxidoreductase [Plantibacter sp. VKM Ac-2880]